MDAYVFILRCSDGSYYTGSTTNLEARLGQHAGGEGGAYTAGRLPVKLVYSCELQSPAQAFFWERQIKGWSRKKKEALICGDYDALVELSKSRTSPDLRRRRDPLAILSLPALSQAEGSKDGATQMTARTSTGSWFPS